MDNRHNVLFLCTGNSCRSQMAEGFLRALADDRFIAHSAGTRPAREVHPLAVEVMAEEGIDISAHEPKGVKPFLGRLPVRHLVIVCDGANHECPTIFPGVLHRHFWPFDDPAEFSGSDEEILAGFRRVRDEIRARIEAWIKDPDAE